MLAMVQSGASLHEARMGRLRGRTLPRSSTHLPHVTRATGRQHEHVTHFIFTLERNLTVGATSGYLRRAECWRGRGGE